MKYLLAITFCNFILAAEQEPNIPEQYLKEVEIFACPYDDLDYEKINEYDLKEDYLDHSKVESCKKEKPLNDRGNFQFDFNEGGFSY